MEITPENGNLYKDLPGSNLDVQLAVESALDPRSKEFQQAVKLTPATLAYYRTKGKWAPAEHLLHISSILAHELSLGEARIIVELPPRHGKSELCSVHTPIWFLEKYPWAHILLATYGADLAEGFGRRVRDAFLENAEGVLTTKVRDDAQRTSHFITSEGGSMSSMGVGGIMTGRGAHLLLIDDYIKNWAEASSDTVLEGCWNWFTTTAYTRLEPGGSCIILATRWVIDDLIGRLKTADKNRLWTVIRLPALAEENDPLNRKEGEPLWPARYSAKALQQIRTVVGPFMFGAMYQQDPKPIQDSRVDVSQLRIVDEIVHPHLYRFVRSWDLAASENKGDWTVGSLMGTNGRPGSSTAITAVAGMVRGQWGPAGVETIIRATAEADGVDISIILEQEPGSSGKSFAQHLATNVLRGFRVTIKPPGRSNKWIRAQPYIAAITHGRIVLLRATWNSIHKKELEIFPHGKVDDTVDSVAQGFNELHLTKIMTPTWGREGKVYRNLIVPAYQVPTSDQSGSDSSNVISSIVFGRKNHS